MKHFVNFLAPIGVLKIEFENNAVERISIVDEKNIAASDNEFAKLVVAELKEYFEGNRSDFSFKVKLDGTDFQKKVWSELQRIPYGETISYQELAKRSGNPKAYRAAGNANGKNPVCIVVPCHRVIHAGGGIGGYAYGVAVKKELLALEKNQKHKF